MVVLAAFVLGTIVIAQAGDPKAEVCKALKGKLDKAVKAFDSAKASFDKTCGANNKLPGCEKLKKTMETAKKTKTDLEAKFEKECNEADEEMSEDMPFGEEDSETE